MEHYDRDTYNMANVLYRYQHQIY